MNIVFDRAVPFYDRTRGLPPEIAQAVADLVRAHTPLRPGSRVLEIGVGSGRIALPLVQHNGYRYVGVDVSRAMMLALRRKPAGVSIALAQADAARLPFADAVFEGLVAVHVFHLVGDWAAAMDEARRVLQRGGVLLVGQTQHASAAGRELRRMLDELAGSGAVRRAAGLLDWNDVMRELETRFGPARDVRTPVWRTESTPRAIIEAYAARTWSSTWLVSDAALQHATEEARRWALQRWGSLDTPLIDEQHFTWHLFIR